MQLAWRTYREPGRGGDLEPLPTEVAVGARGPLIDPSCAVADSGAFNIGLVTGRRPAPRQGFPADVNLESAPRVMGSGMQGTQRIDEVRLREFLADDYPRLVAAIELVAGNQPAAEDAVAEALARAWERSDRGEPIENLPAWVMRTALNLARSRWRKLRTEATTRRRIAHSAEVADPVDERLDIERALVGLSRREREVTVLRYYLCLDVVEIAAALGVSGGTVKTLLFRARRDLATALGGRDEEVQDRAGLR
jgi:RNA polymerase sigma-70 factor (ECF subfamily)